MNNIIQSLKIIILAVVLSFGLSYVYAWTAPALPPPDGNVSAPINTSTTSQVKGALGVGGLGIEGLIRGYSNAIFDGNVGIGTTTPAKKLDVAGDIQASGDVCTTAGGGKCLSAAGGFVITDVRTQGTACTIVGAVAHDGSGSPLFCSYGSWRLATLSGFPGYSSFVYGPWSTTVPVGVSFATVSVYGAGGGGGGGVNGSNMYGLICSGGTPGGNGGKAWIKIPVTSGQVLSGSNTSVAGLGSLSAYAGGSGSGNVTFPSQSLVAYSGGGGIYDGVSSSGTLGTASGGTVVVGGGSAGGAGGTATLDGWGNCGGTTAGSQGTIGGVTIAYSVN